MNPPPTARRKSERYMTSSNWGRCACCLERGSSCARPARVTSLFNLSLLALPLLVVLLSPGLGSSFVVVAPSTRLWPLPRRGGESSTGVSMHQRSRWHEAQNQHQNLLRLPAATTEGAGSRGSSRVLVFRESETRRHALQDDILEGITAAVTPTTEIPVEKLRVPREPPERPPFDLDAAVFLADFAFEAYREPGGVAWDVPGPSSLRFQKGELVSKVFPGLLTVSLLAAEGLPVVLEPIGGDPNNKREREINPSVAMVLEDKDMRSGTLTTAKQLIPGSRFWGELFSMHVHDPATSVLEIGLWDKGEEGAIPLSVTGVFRGAGGKELVGTARVPLPKILRDMSRGRDDSWTGWVEIDPIVLLEEEEEEEEEEEGGGKDKGVSQIDQKRSNAAAAAAATSAGDRDGVSRRSSSGSVKPARLHLDLRFAPMERYHRDELPTAPRASEDDVAAVGGSLAGTVRARWQNLVGQDGAGVDEATDGDAGAAGGDGNTEVYAPGLSANRTFLYKEEGEGGTQEGRSVIAGRMDDGGDYSGGSSSLSSSGGGSSSLSASGGGAKKPSQRAEISPDKSSTSNSNSKKGAKGTAKAAEAAAPGGGGGPWPWSRGKGNGGTDGGGLEAQGRRGGTKDGTRRQGGESTKGKGKSVAVVLREDGMPDWSVLTNRIGGLAQQAGSFELLCFIDNHDTDTQAGVWRDEASKRLVVSFRGTAQLEDILTDVNFLLDDLDHSGVIQKAVLPAVDDVMAAVLNTTNSWKKERVQPLPETLAQQKVYMLQSMSKLLDTSRDLLKDLQDTTTTTTAAGTKQLPGTDKDAAKAPEGEKGSKEKYIDKGDGGGSVRGGDAAVTVVPAEEILSGIKGLLRLGGPAEPASAAEEDEDYGNDTAKKMTGAGAGGAAGKGNEETSDEEEKGRAAAATAAAAAATNLINLLGSSNASKATSATAVSSTANNSTAAAAAATTTTVASGASESGKSGGDDDDSNSGGVIRRGAGKLWKRWKGEDDAPEGGGGGATGKAQDGSGGGGYSDGRKNQQKRNIAGLVVPSTSKGGDGGGGVERGLADTLAWVQQVAGEKMEEMASLQNVLGDETKKQMQLLTDMSEGKVNATESGEMLAQFLREQLEKVEATKELVDRVEEFRDSIGAAGVEWDGDAGGLVGLDALQERVQDQGRKAIDDKITTFQAMLANVTALQQQEQQQLWSKDVVGSGDDGEDCDGDRGGDGSNAAARPTPKIHSGFKRAYVSVNGTLSAVLGSAMDGKPEDWHVYITGHSLGGALATLAALDHRRRYPDAKVTMYNFGSPRVGNRAFAELYDSFVGDSFRVVNNLDVVARMPRATMGGISLDYQHSGRTVMVAEDPQEPPWIQGESVGECPLEETDPVAILTTGKTDFFTAEIEFMKTLFSGKGIDHHMEQNYFAALDSFYDPDDVKEA